MTRKDYVAIAQAIKQACDNPNHFYVSGAESKYLQGCNSVAVAVANTMARDNPAFDRARFLKACGVQS